MTSAQCGNRLPGKWCSGWVNSHKFIISCYRLPVRNYRLPVSCLICGTPRTVQFGFWTIETTCEWSAIESFGWLRAKSLCKTGCGCGRLILLLEPPDPPTETLVLSILHPNVHKSCWIASWLTVRRPIELAIKVPNYVIPVGLPNYFARGPYDLFWQITERVITDELLQTIRAERFLSRADGVRVIQSSCNT